MDVCVCVCSGITLERLEQFPPNFVRILLYVCVRILCMFYIYIYLSPKHQFPKGIWMIHVVEEIKLLLLLGTVRYYVTTGYSWSDVST
jgi:hypothetical protein